MVRDMDALNEGDECGGRVRAVSQRQRSLTAHEKCNLRINTTWMARRPHKQIVMKAHDIFTQLMRDVTCCVFGVKTIN